MALSASGLSIVDGFGPGFMWWIHLVFTYNILQLIAPGTWFFPLPGFTAHMQPTQTLPNSPWLIGISRQRCRLLRLVDSGFYIAYIYIYILIYLFVYLFIYIYIYSIDIEIYLHIPYMIMTYRLISICPWLKTLVTMVNPEGLFWS
jgi:hypothetical protein